LECYLFEGSRRAGCDDIVNGAQRLLALDLLKNLARDFLQ